MRQLRASFVLQITALLCIAAWFVASNHCALTGLLSRIAKDREVHCEHCPIKQDGKIPNSPMSGCCKDIKATDVNFTTWAVSCTVTELPALFSPEPTAADADSIGFDAAGPPEGCSFAVVMLARSFRSLAPPFLA